MVGFGGGSSYIALLILFNVPYVLVPIIGLICNIVVSLKSANSFIKAGHFRTHLLIPFAVTSIPVAFFAGSLNIPRFTFILLLAIALTLAGGTLFFSPQYNTDKQKTISTKKAWFLGIPLGACIGGLAGIVGIGGGIFLSPVLNIIRWGTPKQIACISSVIIVLNSIAGLTGQLTKGAGLNYRLSYLALPIIVLIGGSIGSYFGAQKFPAIWIVRITGILVLYVSFHLWYKILG